MSIQTNSPPVPDALVPRLGERLVQLGHLSRSDLDHALWIQAKRANEGDFILLGQLLVELDLVSEEVLEQSLAQQAGELQTAVLLGTKMLEQKIQASAYRLRSDLLKLSGLVQLDASFVAHLSEELRTPLAMLYGLVEMLAEESLGPLTSQQATAVRAAREANRRLGQVIEDMLQFTEASAVEISVQTDVVPVDKPLLAAMDSVRGRANQHRVALAADIRRPVPMVAVDSEKLAWAITQLLDATIMTSRPGAVILLQTRSHPSHVTIDMTDFCIGDSRAAGEAHPIEWGDLALVRRVLEAHGSRVDVPSSLAQTKRITFSLPLAA